MNKDELWEGLQKADEYQKAFASMSNAEIADLLLNKVWANIVMFTYESELVESVIERLRSGPTPRTPDLASPCPFCGRVHKTLSETCEGSPNPPSG